QTEVYQSISTTNEVEDRYANNEVARRALFGPLSMVIKCIGFDDTYSLIKKETRRHCISWIATPLALLGIVLFIRNVAMNLNLIENAMTWHWGEMFILTFLAIQSLASALFFFFFTRSLFFLDYYEAWSECARLAENYSKEKKEEGENGENEGEKKEHRDTEIGLNQSRFPVHNRGRIIWVLLSFLFFVGSSVLCSVKYALNHGHNLSPNQSATEPLLDNLYAFEPLTSVWAAILTAAALSAYGILNGILIETIVAFNRDLSDSSKSSSLSSQIDSFAIRHQSILGFARLFSDRMKHFASVMAVSGIVANFSAMFLSLCFKQEIETIAHICVILWTLIAIGSMASILLMPAKVQSKLNHTCEILVADKQIWKGEITIAQRAQMMIYMRKNTDTTVSIFKCLKLTPWVANGIMLVPPLIGLTLYIIKTFA
ncbi:hypothetical protein PFISCL1PPCAC_14991, partial [Pristionchus fissidentatus]